MIPSVVAAEVTGALRDFLATGFGPSNPELAHVIDFLTDEGLLPNYAFPEAGVTLKSVIWRSRERGAEDTGADDDNAEATFREMNFGRLGTGGRPVAFAGLALPRDGFRVCRRCGAVQKSGDDGPHHTSTCSARDPERADVADCLYLYREFRSEAVQMLLPVFDAPDPDRRVASFVAALELGLRLHFGGRIRACACNREPEQDGCYRCVFAYRRGRAMADTSRDTAIEMLERILAHRDELTEAPSLGGLTITPEFDSGLEARFVEALRQVEVDGARAVQVRADLVGNRPGFVLRVGDHTWYLEKQAELGATDSVVEPSRPDFLLRPARPAAGRKPVAVFTDGFEFHRDATAADSLKRMALVRAGFLVWSLTWDDLEIAFGQAPDVPDLLAGAEVGEMADLQRTLDARWDTADLRARLGGPTLRLLVEYLRAPDAARWRQAVFTSLFGWFDRQRMLSAALRARFDGAAADALPGQVREALGAPPPPLAVAGLGAWTGTVGAFFDLFAALPLAAVQQGDADAAVVAVHLHDDPASRGSDDYRRVWNGVLRLFTLLQFLPGAWWTTRVGVERGVYPELPPPVEAPAPPLPPAEAPTAEWRAAVELAASEVQDLLRALSTRGAPAPEVGFELVGADGAVRAQAELAWPSRQVAVLLVDDESERPPFEGAGWRVFLAGADGLAEALARALAGGAP